MSYSKLAQLNVEMSGASIEERISRLTAGWFLHIDQAETGAYDISHELQEAAYFAANLNRPTIRITIHVEGDQD